MAIAKRKVEPVEGFKELFDRIEGKLPGAGYDSLRAWRRGSLARFLEQGFPTQKVEAWKYTNIGKYANQAMQLAEKSEVALDRVSHYFAGGPLTRRLIFVNGHLSAELSHIGDLPKGVTVKGLARALDDDPERVGDELARLQDERSLTDLNAAFLQSGAWIEVADDVKVEAPLQLLFLSVGQNAPVMTHPRCLLSLGDRASLHLIETHVSLGEGQLFTNLVSQIRLGAEAELTHDRLELGRETRSFVAKTAFELADRAQLKQTRAIVGGDLNRSEIELMLDGSHIEAQLNGVYMPTAKEHVDTMIRVHHLKPDCHSDQFYKGVMDGKAQAAFAGKIQVYRDSQRTNAYQTNNNLLLSRDAVIDSKPELEIYADDVKCSHGSTCGELDDRALFYLRSRGLDRDEAESLLTYAFAGEVLERFRDDHVGRLAKEAIFDRMPGGDALKGML